MVFRPLLMRMQCCIVMTSTAVTALLVLLNSNIVNASISGTVALTYGIGLGMLVCIVVHDKVVNRPEAVKAISDEAARGR